MRVVIFFKDGTERELTFQEEEDFLQYFKENEDISDWIVIEKG